MGGRCRAGARRCAATVRAVSGRIPQRPPTGALVAGLLLAGVLACVNGNEEEMEAEYQAQLHAGHVALQSGAPDDAADAYRRALLARPDDADALLGLARCHSARGDGRSALTVLMRLEARHPAYHRARASRDLRFALYQAAKQHLWDGDSARALKLTKRLRELEPGHPGLQQVRAEALLREAARFYVGGRVPEAEQLTSELVGRRVQGPGAALALAEVLLEKDRPALAISVLSDASRRHPRDMRLQVLMERALRIRYPNELPPENVAPPTEEGVAGPG